MFRVVALVQGADGRTLRLDAPLVGRARPLQALVTAFDSAVDGRSFHLFTVLGAAGVGKSRLVRELAESLGDAARVLRGRCMPYGEGITYLPLLEALPGDAASALEPTDPGERLHPRVRGVLEDLARDRPLVLILDDLHWAEPAFLDLVEDVASTSREAPLLVVCLARPELIEHRPGSAAGCRTRARCCSSRWTSPTPSGSSITCSARPTCPMSVRAHIVSVGRGKPALRRGAARDPRRAGRAAGDRRPLDDGGDRHPRPASIQALIAARIDRLPDPERFVLELASIEGKRFTRTLVAGLAADERAAAARRTPRRTRPRPSSSGRAPTAISRSGTS